MKLLQMAKFNLGDGLTQIFPIYVNVFNFTQISIKPFFISQI